MLKYVAALVIASFCSMAALAQEPRGLISTARTLWQLPDIDKRAPILSRMLRLSKCMDLESPDKTAPLKTLDQFFADTITPEDPARFELVSATLLVVIFWDGLVSPCGIFEFVFVPKGVLSPSPQARDSAQPKDQIGGLVQRPADARESKEETKGASNELDNTAVPVPPPRAQPRLTAGKNIPSRGPRPKQRKPAGIPGLGL